MKSARDIFFEYPYVNHNEPMPFYVPVSEHETLRRLLERWVNKANDGLIDDTFNGVRSPELEQLIADTKAVLGE